MLGTFFRLLKTLNEAVDKALQEELERTLKEIEELEDKGGNVRVEEYRTPWGVVRVETFEIVMPPVFGGLEGRIVELDEEKEEERKEDDDLPLDGFIDVGGVPMKIERRGRDWREENR